MSMLGLCMCVCVYVCALVQSTYTWRRVLTNNVQYIIHNFTNDVHHKYLQRQIASMVLTSTM